LSRAHANCAPIRLAEEDRVADQLGQIRLDEEAQSG
jgi:hypothetical protein